MEQPMTSEEKLLKLIRKSPQVKEPKKEAVKNNKTRVDFLALSNKLLVFLFLGLLTYVLVDVFYLQKKVQETDQVELSSIKTEDVEVPLKIIEEKPFEIYQSEFERRNIFQYPWEKADPNQLGPANAAQISELPTLIKVTGILMGASPQVIVEDIKTQQSFFLSPGESVLNAVVEEIKADRVIFNYNSSKVEMIP